MLSINTNLSSLIAQQSLSSSTAKLNQAIERMSTGFKINHAKDNAANYSISTNMSTQIGAYDIAADNVAMGMDLVTTASDIISNMQDKASRLQALSTQARNGTYGAQSMAAINSEAAAIMAEINRLYSTAEYNNISLFTRKPYEIAEHLPKANNGEFIEETSISVGIAEGEIVGPISKAPEAKYNGFIENPKTYTDAEVATMTRVKDINKFVAGETYAIYTLEELQKLANYVNTGKDTTNVEFVLGADIDLSSIVNWTPIGDCSTSSSYQFKGTFDGNGHVIRNITINNKTKSHQGLFGKAANSVSEIKNLGIVDCKVNGREKVGGLAGSSYLVSNCYVSGEVIGTGGSIGGLVGYAIGEVKNSYSRGVVVGKTSNVGGLIGQSSTIIKSFSTCDVNGEANTGGLAGKSGQISNSYAIGNVNGSSQVGGLVGISENTISNCYSTGDVTSSAYQVGGLIGHSQGNVVNSYATGTVIGSSSHVGGLIGYSSVASKSISNSYAIGNVFGSGNSVGGLIGYTQSSITNSYAEGRVKGSTSQVGGLVGKSTSAINNSYAVGNIEGVTQVGGLAGCAEGEVNNSYASGNILASSSYVGGLIGDSSSAITNSYSTGDVVSSSSCVGGLVGGAQSAITNCYAKGDITSETGYRVGGLVGSAENNADIVNSYAQGRVTGDGAVGGLVGYAENDIINSYATGIVEGDYTVGGLAGHSFAFIENCYSTGNVSGKNQVGGLVGVATQNVITDSVSYSKTIGDNYVGAIIGKVEDLSDNFNLINIATLESNNGSIGCYFISGKNDLVKIDKYENIVKKIILKQTSTTLQVGINSDESCQINFDTNFKFDLSSLEGNIASDEAFGAITEFINLLSERSTQLGAVQNRLDSALESIEVNLENLVSSRSTIRDADIAEESSAYIRQQILQQASATLLATANQSPSIALQLI